MRTDSQVQHCTFISRQRYPILLPFEMVVSVCSDRNKRKKQETGPAGWNAQTLPEPNRLAHQNVQFPHQNLLFGKPMSQFMALDGRFHYAPPFPFPCALPFQPSFFEAAKQCMPIFPPSLSTYSSVPSKIPAVLIAPLTAGN